jgi:hypothetical protein
LLALATQTKVGSMVSSAIVEQSPLVITFILMLNNPEDLVTAKSKELNQHISGEWDKRKPSVNPKPETTADFPSNICFLSLLYLIVLINAEKFKQFKTIMLTLLLIK